MEIAATAAPTENISFTFIKLLNKNRYGIKKTLNDMKLTIIPLFPNMILGKDMTHAKTIELTGISDHVKSPDTAILQIRHTIIPIKSVAENKMEIITFFVILFSSPFCKAIKFSSLSDSSFFIFSIILAYQRCVLKAT